MDKHKHIVIKKSVSSANIFGRCNEHRKLLPGAKAMVICFTALVTLMLPTYLMAQDTSNNKPTLYLNDTLNYQIKNKGFLKKLLQPIKFKKNRDSNEIERVYEYVQKLINDGNLNIDESVSQLNELIEKLKGELDSINSIDSVKIATIDELASKNRIADSLINNIIDSLHYEMEEIKRKLKNDTLTRQKRDSIDHRKRLLKLRSIGYTYRYLKGKLKEGDSTLLKTEKHFLSPTKSIIGWHDVGNATEEHKNYNYNYLTAINLSSYELASNGTPKNERELERLLNGGGIIDYARNYYTDLYLTVNNGSAIEVSDFLGNKSSQNTFIDHLKAYCASVGLKGVNIYFEDLTVDDSRAFVAFVQNIRDSFAATASDFEILVTIPSIYDQNSLNKVQAYNFIELNRLVDSYLVLTDQMVPLKNAWAEPNSPLFKKDNSRFGTIQTTMDFYSNGKIPVSKLIITVSYSGVEWPVIGFEGKNTDMVKKNSEGKKIQFNRIQDFYIQNKEYENRMEKGIDTAWAMAYLNITGKGMEPDHTKIWYENEESLLIKYNWVKQNNLSGISIRNLGSDDGYTQLWDVLGLSFTSITTNKLNGENEESYNDETNDKGNLKNSRILLFSLLVLLIVLLILFRRFK